ncbi:uncharacterized protein LOC118826142 [Colossoma macropomum]|uniref:uncharacterized protein LOC118826142 n=1 Tax=Colossoma macropomum TaxID=42526 RepID=UPI001864A25E|nr:uncharacterized protein LOC118826142 [Colossoma macropomum]
MIPFYALVFVTTAVGGTSIDVPCLNGPKYINGGKNISLNCFFSPVDPAATAWFKQTPGEKPLLIASAFDTLQVKYHNDFDKTGRFNVASEKSSFNLSISNAEPSDSATYYCVFTYYTDATLLDCTVLVLKGPSSSLSAVLQPPVLDPVELGGDTTLQCSRDLSLSDAGTYYCAVLMCGQIIFGNGTKLDFVVSELSELTKFQQHSIAHIISSSSCIVMFFQEIYYLKSLAMIPFYALVFLSTASGGTSKADNQCLNGLKYLHWGENIHLNCFFPSVDSAATAWFKHTPGEKPLLIASAFRSTTVTYHNDFDKSGRFNAVRTKDTFNLSISNAEPSDSATYYCAFAYYTDAALVDCTVLVLKGSSSSLSAVLQPPVSDPVELGGDTTLQCSILTDASAGEHSVYWFRHGSGESHPGIIYTHGNRSDECKRSSETDSPTQSCVYKLPKRNLSLSDAGTYYCAVLMCGEIIFGNGTKLDFVEKGVMDPTLIGLAASNIISVVVVLFLCRKLYYSHHKGAAEGHTVQANQAEDTDVLNYAALSFAQSSSSRRSRTKNSSDQPVYAQVKTHQ